MTDGGAVPEGRSGGVALEIRGGAAFATLDRPASLNALDLDAVTRLRAALRRWLGDPRVAVVVLCSGDPRAFCAGGDVKRMAIELRAAGRAEGSEAVRGARAFFREEYALDRLIHEYPKPLVVWGEGWVMGGGWGLFAGASSRIVTETTALAMPEISIGFFADVGAGYFLNRLPAGMGLFLAWTGARVSGRAACALGLADHRVPGAGRARFFEALAETRWEGNRRADEARLRTLVSTAALPVNVASLPLDRAEREATEREIAGLRAAGARLAGKSFADAVAAMDEIAGLGEAEARAVATFRAGSPTSARVMYEHLARTRGATPAAALAFELALAERMILLPDFSEGVRAALIDKDRRPRFTPADVGSLREDAIEALFEGLGTP